MPNPSDFANPNMAHHKAHFCIVARLHLFPLRQCLPFNTHEVLGERPPPGPQVGVPQ